MKKILSLFTLLFAICGMAWGQETAEPFKVSAAPTESGWAENTTWYYMKIKNTKWISTDAAYCDNQGNIKLMNTEKPTNDKGLWCFVKNEDGTYTIYNKSDRTKVLGFTPTGDNNNNGSGDRAKLHEPTAQNVSTKFEFKRENETSGYFAFRSTSKFHIVEARGDAYGTDWLASWNKNTEITGSPDRKIEFIEYIEPFKVSDAPTENGWAENTTWYYMKIKNTKWISTDAAYCDNQGNIKLMNTEKPTNDKGLWCFVKNEDGTYTIYNKSDRTKVLGFTPTSDNNNNGSGDRAKLHEPTAQNVSTKFEFKRENETGGYFAFRSASKFHIVEARGDGNGTDWLASWNRNTEITGSTDRKIEFIENTENTKRGLLRSTIDDAETNWLPYEGESVGKFTAAEQKKTLEQVLTDAESLYQATGSEEEYEAAIAEINATIAAMTINQPIAGHFYAIKGKVNGKYIDGGITSQNNAKTTDKVNGAFKAGHLFYLTNDKKLLNFAAGYYMVNTHTVNAGTANTWTFHASKGNIKENGVAYYTLQSNLSGAGQFLYDNGSGSNTYCDRNSSYKQNNCDWAIEEVTELPVTVSAAGWATLYAPVALTIPADVTVYTATVVGNTLKLTALTDKIPANTPVLIEAAANTYNFTIDYSAAATEAATTGLKGTIETINKPATTIFTLQKPADKKIGFYKYTGETLKGFRAYGENLLGAAAAAEGLIFDKGDVTGIENIEINQNGKTVIYDLSGRRVEKMDKGIYIVNGKKVIK